MSRQYFDEVLGDPPVANQTTVAAAADTVLWDAASKTAIQPGSLRDGQMFRVIAFGVTSTAVTAGQTLIVTPRFGTSTSGTSLGASIATPIHAVAVTNVPWFLEMYVHFRSTGASGLATCAGYMVSQTIVGTAATTNRAPLTFGTASTTATGVNTTVTSGLVVSVTPSLATQTFTTLGVAMTALN